MKELQISCNFKLYESIEKLPIEIQNLMSAAQKARTNAYAPYSNFLVGAALELENGTIIDGNNQENAAYPSGLCAERTALFFAGSKWPNKTIKRMAITAGSAEKKADQPIPPCGSCRQALIEYEQKQGKSIELYFMGTTGNVVYSESVENLLPWIFDKNLL